ncbi:MAG: tRNA (adenosine(37)-N6)-dimethylallyltransferase MiaA [Lentimicrobiaceae bacterium]|nr:tRNA (adenosine(37)-N6)-dimethylallyltransferase MiaA [Lentimicrobiaceae bacterium]MBR3914161.1 tRNA (adenosine(37)-N6)-dimethylallyltransferase MiaA [Bacteroidales bacterium]
MNDKYLIVIAGPTASGKTATAITIAKALRTVIISADSRQFYREIPIGTAAPTREELSEVEHYMIHNLSIEDRYDVADYEKDVLLLLKKLFLNHDAVVMTGGSGLFIDAVCNGLDSIPDISDETRNRVNALYEKGGVVALQNELQHLDPEYYEIVDKHNPRRLQRAIEVCYQTGLPYSSFRKNNTKERDFKIIKLALLWERNELITRINKRVENMISDGLVEEARSVYHKRNLNSLNTVGYKEMFQYFDGDISLNEAIELIKISTRQYAKRQMTWLRKNNDYRWFSIDEIPKMIEYIQSVIN